MFGKVKKWLGFDSVKIKLKPLEVYPYKVETLNAELEFTANAAALVTYVKVKLIERYTRGRGDNQKIDEYLLGEWISDEAIELDGKSPKIVFFKLPFKFQHSNIEKLEHSNLVGKGIASIFKTLKSAKSDYRLEAQCLVEDSNKNPEDRVKVFFL
jgi:hypothetical protein